ncbi:MAG: UDP-N-acetylmuramoyl-tripeptide--D-alanyl-D-alanine ligase [Nitrospirota bacterium]|nr:UDP-N-acetylmuramoyl-tripeptide--D-alanyl-D-alanine ligase [Nitrospirota bacterium]
MTIVTVDEIVQATGGKVLCGKQEAFSGLSIDSRNIGSGELFIALRGQRFDGHDFVRDALQSGSGALVSVPPAEPGRQKTIIHVTNTLKALHDLARFRRLKRKIPVVSVTGTNGKTTTKELIASILSQKHRVLKTTGNFNNHIGLPLCVSNMQGDEEFAVLEMGSNARGDIRELCGIVQPDIAVVTNVGQAHLEGFGSIEAVRDTDLEVLDHVKTVSVNSDDSFLMQGMSGFTGKAITYGIDSSADFSATDIALAQQGSKFTLCMPKNVTINVSLKISGRFNVLNALAAASIAFELGISPEEIRQGLEAFTGVPMRLEIRRFSGALVINDVYNANPASMEEALKELVRLKKARTIAVVGDMLELGTYAEDAHSSLVKKMNELKIDILIAVGPEMQKAAAAFSGACYWAADSDEARTLLLGMVEEDDTILIKGSRGIRMEKVLAGEGKPVEMEVNNAL